MLELLERVVVCEVERDDGRRRAAAVNRAQGLVLFLARRVPNLHFYAEVLNLLLVEKEGGADRRLFNRVEFFVDKAVDDRRLANRRLAERDDAKQVGAVVEVHVTIGERLSEFRAFFECERVYNVILCSMGLAYFIIQTGITLRTASVFASRFVDGIAV